MLDTGQLHKAVACAVLLLCICFSSPVSAQIRFNLPAQPMAEALKAVGVQAGINIYFDPALVRGLKAPELRAELSADAALARLLAGTRLRAARVDANTVRVISDPPAKPASSNVPPAAPAKNNPSRLSTASDSAAAPVDDQAGRSDVGTQTLGEVVVTAQRRAQSLQNVPISVVAFTRESLEKFHVEDIADIIRLTPGVAATYTAGGFTPIISVRGISSNVGQSTTGVYIDDTPIQVRYIGAGATSSQGFPAVFDLERVEVLRGPQGTLFGAGSEGGTVRFITPDPSFTQYSGHARMEFGSNEENALSYQLGAAYGGPIGAQDLAFRVSAYLQQDGGWIAQKPYPDPFLSQNNSNDATTVALTGAVAWAPSDSITVTPKFYFQNQRTGGVSVYTAGDSNPSRNQFVNNAVVPQPSEDQMVLPSLKVDWHFLDVALLSNTSYMRRTVNETLDYTLSDNVAFTGDYTGPIAPAPGYNQNPQQQVTQEIRLQSMNSSRITWVVGGFFQRLTEKAIQPVVAPGFNAWAENVFGESVTQLLGVPVLPGDLIYLGEDWSGDTQRAVFGQASVNLLEGLTATVGLRYGTDKFQYTNYQNGPFNGGPTGSAGGGSQSMSTPKVGLEYRPVPGLMFYTSAAKGWRPGGPDTPVPASCDGDLNRLGYLSEPSTYKLDYVWSYEVGSKGAAFDRHLLWGVSGYYVRWSQPQTQFLLPTCGYSTIANAGSAISKGFDLQAQLAATDHLNLEVSLGYDDARYAQDVAAAGGSNVVTKGQLLPTPPWQAMLSVDYVIGKFGSRGMQAYVHADDTYASGYNPSSVSDALYDPLDVNIRDTNNLTGIRLGARRDAWDVSLFATNLFNVHPIVNTIHQGGATSPLFDVFTVPPRVVGVTGRFIF